MFGLFHFFFFIPSSKIAQEESLEAYHILQRSSDQLVLGLYVVVSCFFLLLTLY